MKKNAKQRIIYDNYNLSSEWDNARAFLEEEHAPEDITDEMIWDFLYKEDETTWDDEKERLINFFSEGTWLIVGTVGLWTGQHAAGEIFTDFEKMFYTAAKDCDYWKFWDENGHLYFKCSHHDGTNYFEIKRINQKALDLIEKWEYDYSDKRTEGEIHNLIFNCNLFSSLPHYAYITYGCAKREAENV